MMTERPHFVVDASVAVAALLQSHDEPYTDLANEVLANFRDGRLRLVAPEHLRAEVGHALLRAVRRRRLSPQQGAEALDLFYSWEIETMRHTAVLLSGWQLAQRYGCSCYAAGYLALAVMTDNPNLHADRRLRNVLRSQFPNELWIERYPQ